MGRASKEEAGRTRARIVETAAELFRASGVEAVSVADVMGALGLTVGGFYKHFASKDALVAEAMALAFGQAGASWDAITTGDGTGTPRRRLVDHYLRPKPAHQRCPMIAFGPHAAGTDSGAAVQAAFQEGTAALLARFTQGAGSDAAPDRDALVLFAAMVGAQALSQAGGDAGWVAAIRSAVEESGAVA